MALHLIKLAVGIATLDGLRARQAGAARPLRHTTRNFPRRAEELLDGGSIYWVIDRVVTARQRLVDIVTGDRADGSKGCDLLLDPKLVAVQGRFVKPFQGWRYLTAADAPLDEAAHDDGAALPAGMRVELARLGLL
jgi:hypothetical protein